MAFSLSSTSTTAAPMVAQTWVYPPPSAATPSFTSNANFGPVHLNDEMVLQWRPSTTQAQINLACNYASGYTNLMSTPLSEPFLYKFTDFLDVSSSSDPIFCYMMLSSSSVGGSTVVWQFNTTASDEIRTWQANAASATVTSLLSTKTGTASVSAHQTSKSSSPSISLSTTGGGHGSVSTSATAGIAVGVFVAALAICAALFFFWRSKRNRRHTNNQSQGWDQQQYHNQLPQQPMSEAPSDGVFRHEAPTNYTPNELAAHSPNQVSAVQTPVELPSR